MWVKRLLRNVNLLNLLLLASALLFTNFILLPLLETSVQYAPPAPKAAPVEEKAEESPPQPVIPSPMEYTIISEQNLFHPERRIPPEKKEAPPLPKPEFVLYGTLVTQETQLAFMEDKKAPYSTPGRGPRQTALKLGQPLSGFVLKEIGTDKVMMVRGEETIVVYLNETTRPKTREGAVTTSAPGAPPPVPQPAVTPRQRGQAVTPAPQTAPQPARSQAPAQQPVVQGSSQGQAPAELTPSQEQAAAQSKAAAEEAKKTFLDFFKAPGRGRTR